MVSTMDGLKVQNVELLLTITGLSKYRDHVPIIYLGTLDQEVWIYYRTDAALQAPFDPISRTFTGPVRNHQAVATPEQR